MNQYPSVGIGILNWNGKKYLESFLHFLYQVTYPNHVIYVIDNNSSDDSISYLQQHHPTVKIIQTGGNYGVAGGYNRGFAQMPEDYLLMLNSDVEVTPGFLEPLVQTMEADKGIGMCQSKLLAYHNKQQFEHGGAGGGMMDFLGYSFCRGRVFDTVENDNQQYKTGDIFWAGGACALIRKQVYHQVQGMYEYYFMHFEEIDMCWQMQAHGHRIVYCNESAAYHVGGGTLSYQSPVKTYYNFRNNLIMVCRNATWLYLLWWLPVRFWMDQLATVSFLAKKDTKNAAAIFKAYVGLFKWLFDSKEKRPAIRRSLLKLPVVLKRSIVWLYFVKGIKNFTAIKSSR